VQDCTLPGYAKADIVLYLPSSQKQTLTEGGAVLYLPRFYEISLRLRPP